MAIQLFIMKESITVELEATLYERNRNHFSQAQGTPFTVPPLSEALQFDGVTAFGKTILQGKAIPESMKVPKAA
jgi:hypothetical protein